MNAPTNINVTARLAKALSRDVDKLFSDNEERETVRQAMRLLMEKADARQVELIDQEIAGQLEINVAEAKSGTFFQSGWRPIVGWVSVAVLAYSFILRDLLIIAATLLSTENLKDLPELDLSAIWALLTGMLGIGTMRSYDKNSRIKKGGTGA